MRFKEFVGTAFHELMESMIKLNHRSVPFIPNGRIVVLDIKRAGVKPLVIFDVGANEGQTANYYAKQFKNAVIYSFEPVKTAYDKMVTDTAGNKRIKTFNKALGDNPGEAKIYKSEGYSGVSSLKGADNDSLPYEETIQVITGMSVVEEHHIQTIDLLKIDTEGFEISVLDGLKPMLKDRVKFIYVEASFDVNNTCQTYISTLLAYLNEHGFIVSGLYSPHRKGFAKLKLDHCDVLLINTNLIKL